jgi:hypothetical protein
MPDNIKIVSPKHFALMTEALRNVYAARFDEADIRILLLGVREFSESASQKN